MRFDTAVYFERVQPGEYDATTGDYRADTVYSEMLYASVTDSTTETMRLVYGELKQGSKTVRLQNRYTAPFDRVKIGGKRYRVDRSRELRTKHTFVVSEVQ